MMEFVVETVAEVTKLPLCLDTTNHVAMEAGINKCLELGLPKPIVNSFSAQPDKMENILPLAAKYDCEIIGLTMGAAIPIDANERVAIAYELVMAANEAGIPNEKIYIDPIILPIGRRRGPDARGGRAWTSCKMLTEMFEPNGQDDVRPLQHLERRARSLCGRRSTTCSCPCSATVGMTSAIVDALDKEMMRTIRLIKALSATSRCTRCLTRN